jgi:predicted nucleic acid-binding protein
VVSAVVLLDSGPLGLLSHPHNSPQPVACRQWAARLQAAGRRVIVPEITDYEVRRELLRANKPLSVVLLDALAQQLEYLPLTTAARRRAAELWAQARQQGQPTAGDNTIDADMILAAQALTLGAPAVVVATTNVGHLSRFVPAELWQNVAP